MMIFLTIISFLAIFTVYPVGVQCVGKKTQALDAVASITGNYTKPYTIICLQAGIYKLSFGDFHYLVRFTDRKWLPTRQTEAALQEYAAANGFGPKLFFQDLAAGILVMEFLEEASIPADFVRSHEHRQFLVEMLKKLHAAPIVCCPKNRQVDGVISRMRCNKKNPDGIDMEVIIGALTFLKQFVEDPADNCVVHGDLHIKNLIFQNDHYKAIDFECVAWDSCYVDLAAIAMHYCMSADEERDLLHLYFGVAPTRAMWLKLSVMKCFSLALYGTWMFEWTDEMRIKSFLPVPYFSQLAPELPKLDYSDSEVRYRIGCSMFKELGRQLDVLVDLFFTGA